MKFDFFKNKNWLIALCSIVLFFVVAAIYCAPQFGGKVLSQHDVQQYEGMRRDIVENRLATGEDAQWTGRMFGGMPAFLIDVKYPAQAVKGTVGKVVKIIDTPASFLFFAMTAMWVAMLLFGLSPWVSLIAALAYGFSTYFLLIIGAGHITKMWALVYAPLMMGGVYFTLHRNMWAGAALTALFTSLEIGANHPQITYYFALAMAAMWLSEGYFALRGKRLGDFFKRTALLAVAGLFAVGSNLSPLWYTMQHSKETIRGGSELVAKDDVNRGSDGLDLQYATAWSYGKAESFTLLVPDFMGGTSADTFAADGAVAAALNKYGLGQMAQYLPRYRGTQPYTAGPTYLGAAAIFLAILALFVLPNRQRWWIVAATLLTILMSWGNNLMWLTALLFDYLPGYNKFRTLSMALVVVQWTVPLLAALGIGRVISNCLDEKQLRRSLLWATGLTAGVLLVMIFGGRSLGDFGQSQSQQMLAGQFQQLLQHQGAADYIKQGLHEQMAWDAASAIADERADVMAADAWRSLIFVLLAAGALWLYSKRKVLTSPALLCVVLTAIVAVDLINVDTRYLNHDSFMLRRQTEILPTEADKVIMQDKDPAYRVFNLSVSPFNDASTSYFHRSVGGYHGAKLSRYQDVIDRYLMQIDERVLDMLNVRYFIGESATADAVIERPTANGAAWLVESVVRASSPHEEIELIGKIDNKHEAVFGNDYLPSKIRFSAGEIALKEYRPNYLRYEYSAEGDALAIFSEIYTREGWTATVDGQQVTPLRANYILRALELPAGNHTVEWRYRAPKWSLIEGITLLFSIAVLAAVALTLILYLRNERGQKNKA
ncbi:MAG: YfhO family protein [Alistipes sp.]|nr:YfhO family protein [Alistipes sp.]